MALFACKVGGAEGTKFSEDNPLQIPLSYSTSVQAYTTLNMSNSGGIRNPLTKGFTKLKITNLGGTGSTLSINGTSVSPVNNQTYDITTDDNISFSNSFASTLQNDGRSASVILNLW